MPPMVLLVEVIVGLVLLLSVIMALSTARLELALLPAELGGGVWNEGSDVVAVRDGGWATRPSSDDPNFNGAKGGTRSGCGWWVVCCCGDCCDGS